jgi:hypothetical protein
MAPASLEDRPYHAKEGRETERVDRVSIKNKHRAISRPADVIEKKSGGLDQAEAIAIAGTFSSSGSPYRS